MPPFCVMTETDRFERIAGKLNFEIFNPLFEKLSIFLKFRFLVKLYIRDENLDTKLQVCRS